MRLSTFALIFQAVTVTWASAISWPRTSTTADTRNSHISSPTSHGSVRRDLSGGGEDSRSYEKEGPGFWRFEWVHDFLQSGDRLARSSAPHYNCKDCDQRLTPASIDFLKRQKITHVISLNSEATSRAIREDLRKNNIAYTALPVEDFHPPTVEDLKKGYEAFKSHRSGTLVWCGYGHGRTGTMVSALQIMSQNEKLQGKKLGHWEYKANHVETPDQMKLLDTLQKTLHPGTANHRPQSMAENLRAAELALARYGSSSKASPRVGTAEQATSKPSRLRPKEFSEMDQPINRPSVNAPKVMADSNPGQTRSSTMPPRPGVKVFDKVELPTKKPSTKGPKVMADPITKNTVPKSSGQRLPGGNNMRIPGSPGQTIAKPPGQRPNRIGTNPIAKPPMRMPGRPFRGGW